MEVLNFGSSDADILLVQMVGDHELDIIEKEVTEIARRCPGQDFSLKAVKVSCWNRDLSPWPAPAVFGKEEFGAGARETLQFILEEVLPERCAGEEGKQKRTVIGGYSLAGLFALWAGYQTDRFDGIAAASPSIWFPRFRDYMRENEMRAMQIYLSLGDREERTRNPVMAQVGEAIREGENILKNAGKECILEWNQGNHFRDPDLRMAKAFSWVISAGQDAGLC